MELDAIIKYVKENNPVAKHKAASKAHAAWYDDVLPHELDTKHRDLGLARVTGTPRDTAAEYAGAMDWAQRSPYPKPVDAGLALVYQLLNHGLTKNARDNMLQDISAIWNTDKDKKLTQSQIIELAAKYAKQNDFGTAPTDVLPVEEEDDILQMYYQGGLASVRDPIVNKF